MLPPEKWTRVVGQRGRGGRVVIETSLVAFTTFNFHNDYDMQYMAAVHMCVCVTGCACVYGCVWAPLGTLTRLSFGG